MTASVIIRVADFTGVPLAVATDDGQRINDRIAPLLQSGIPVSLSFAGIEIIIGAFLSAVVVPLYGGLSGARVDNLLSVQNMNSDDCAMFKRVIVNAKRYQSNPVAFDTAWADVIDDDPLEEARHYEIVEN